MDLNLRQLGDLVTVVEEGHFGRAAAKLHISPSALSQQIRKLERQVGFPLLNRDDHPVNPTPSGRLFLEEVRTIVEAAAAAEAVARCEARRTRRRYDIGFSVTPLGYLTRPVLEALSEKIGGGVARLIELPFTEQTSAVSTGKVDAAFVWGPTRTTDLLMQLAVTAPRVLAVAASHPLSSRPAVRIEELSDETFVQLAFDLVDEAWSRWWSVDPRPNGTPVRYGPVANTIAEFLEHVASGRAVAITSSLLKHANARPDVTLIPIENVPPSDVLLCTRPNDNSSMTQTLCTIVSDLHSHSTGDIR